MKLSKSLLAVSMSAAILFSSPATSIGNIQSQTVEAAVTNNCRLNKNAVSLDTGKGTQLTLSNATVSNITWRSLSPNIISVDNRGYVKGLKAGSAYVYATYKGVLYKCKVTVKETVSLNVITKTLKEGESLSLNLNNRVSHSRYFQ